MEILLALLSLPILLHPQSPGLQVLLIGDSHLSYTILIIFLIFILFISNHTIIRNFLKLGIIIRIFLLFFFLSLLVYLIYFRENEFVRYILEFSFLIGLASKSLNFLYKYLFSVVFFLFLSIIFSLLLYFLTYVEIIDYKDWAIRLLSLNENNVILKRQTINDFNYYLIYYFTVLPIHPYMRIYDIGSMPRLPFFAPEPAAFAFFIMPAFFYSLKFKRTFYGKLIILTFLVSLLLARSFHSFTSAFLGLVLFYMFSLVKTRRNFYTLIFTLLCIGAIIFINLEFIFERILVFKYQEFLFYQERMDFEISSIGNRSGDERETLGYGFVGILGKYGLLGLCIAFFPPIVVIFQSAKIQASKRNAGRMWFQKNKYLIISNLVFLIIYLKSSTLFNVYQLLFVILLAKEIFLFYSTNRYRPLKQEN